MTATFNAQADHASFIYNNTQLIAPPLVPEIKLHLAEETLPLWEKTEEQLGLLNVPPPFWAFAWPGGQALARYLLDNKRLVAGKRVVDLGAGSGLCAIAACMAGAADVLAADIDPLAEHAIALNAWANGVAVRATADDLLANAPPPADALLIGDIFYEKALSDKVMEWCASMASADVLILVGDPKRSFFPDDRFEKIDEYSVPVISTLEDVETKATAIWQFKSTACIG